MIELFKLFRLPHTQKVRKIIKILELLERECTGERASPFGSDVSVRLSCDTFYIEGLCNHVATLYPDDSVIVSAAGVYADALRAKRNDFGVNEYRKLFNTLRHALYRHSDVLPSEWDLIMPGTRYAAVPADADLYSCSCSQRFYPGIYVYAEDIRAPFNLGSIFRTAEAFGTEKLFLSAGCVSPEQPRAQRSAMGCTRFLPWEYRTLETLPAGVPVFALETGGTPITSFLFPQQGVVLLGSEELGLSAEALKKASAGIVSIPMKGIKASLNVAVAFGILMQYWTAAFDS